MAVDFKDLESRLVSSPLRLRRAVRRVPAPSAVAPSRVVVLPVPQEPDPAVVLSVAPVSQPRPTVRVDDVPGTSYWVRRRRAEAQASDQA
jgi:hypothetical protein